MSDRPPAATPIAPGGSSIGPIASISHARAGRTAGRRQNPLDPEIGQKFVQAGPGQPTIHGAPHAEIVGHHDLIRVSGRYRHAVLSEADHRLRLERSQVGPSAAAVFRPE